MGLRKVGLVLRLGLGLVVAAAHHTQTHTHLTALFPGLPGWAGTRKVKPIWILLKQETVSVASAGPYASLHLAPDRQPRQHLTSHHSVFYRPDALPAAQPAASKHWRPPQRRISYLFQGCHRSVMFWTPIAADMPIGTRKFDRGLGQILHDQLHWRDVSDRVLFKLAVTVYQCLNGRAPPYLSEHCVPVSTLQCWHAAASAFRQP